MLKSLWQVRWVGGVAGEMKNKLNFGSAEFDKRMFHESASIVWIEIWIWEPKHKVYKTDIWLHL